LLGDSVKLGETSWVQLRAELGEAAQGSSDAGREPGALGAALSIWGRAGYC
jgi:hypothetical protein